LIFVRHSFKLELVNPSVHSHAKYLLLAGMPMAGQAHMQVVEFYMHTP